jgi:hypothetical protein
MSFVCDRSCNPFNSQLLISHLTNSNGCGNLQPKVSLTVSPFRPFLLPQPNVYPRTVDFYLPLFSCSYKSLLAQTLSFHIHTKRPGVWGGIHPSSFRILSRANVQTLRSISTFGMNTCKSVPKQRTLTTFRMNTYAKSGGRGAASLQRPLVFVGGTASTYQCLRWQRLTLRFLRHAPPRYILGASLTTRFP